MPGGYRECSTAAWDEVFKDLPARAIGKCSQIVPVEVEAIEQPQPGRDRSAVQRGRFVGQQPPLQQCEVREPGGIQGNQFSVDDDGVAVELTGQRVGNLGEPCGK